MQGVLQQVGHKYKIMSFLFFSLTIDFLKMLIDLAFLTPTLSLFYSFIQYEKNVSLKDFVLVGSGLMIEADDDLSK